MITGLIFLSGVLVAGGLVLIAANLVPAAPQLAEAVARLDRGAVVEAGSDPSMTKDHPAAGGPSDRLGSWLYRRSPVPLTSGQRRALQMQDRTVSQFYADKAVWLVIGCTLPPILAGLWALATGSVPITTPILAALLGGVVGFFVPDLLLRAQGRTAQSDASAALLMYIDLVTLERLANASSSQALQHAAELSDVALFRQLRACLERSRLEQRAPFAELRRLADDLGVPELRDLADVMQLDESGAALSGSLRARVRELRDAHLTTALREANAASEGMTVYMTIPSMIFALVFLVPALLRLVNS